MTRVRLVHWSAEEARERIAALEAAGFTVDYELLENQRAVQQIRQDDPQAILIDLTRLPAQGRDLALWLRQQKSTRDVPLVIVEGAREKVEALVKLLPDATYTDWKRIRSAVDKAIAHPPKQPIVPESVFAGYSGTPLPRKLGIKSGMVVALVKAPPGFEVTLGSLPEDVELRPSGRGHRDLTLCFVRSRRELERRIRSLVKVADQGNVWIAWPKKASGVVTDLTQADVRRTGLDAGLVDFKICAIDETWSGLCFALRRG
jgi:CheY-like chemotaxis protein